MRLTYFMMFANVASFTRVAKPPHIANSTDGSVGTFVDVGFLTSLSRSGMSLYMLRNAMYYPAGPSPIKDAHP